MTTNTPKEKEIPLTTINQPRDILFTVAVQLIDKKEYNAMGKLVNQVSEKFLRVNITTQDTNSK